MVAISCKLCRSNTWIKICHIEFGIWLEQEHSLHRDSAAYPMGECQVCHHVQMLIDYDEQLLKKLYFHSTQEAIMWHETLLESLQPYQQMVDLVQPYLAEHPVIADFGCGTGALLQAIQQSAINPAKLIGTDFNPRCSIAGITYLEADLNQLAALNRQHWPLGLDLAMASHVLEHLIDPLLFLQQIRTHLTAKGLVFLEVPDFSHPAPGNLSGISNLVNLQHIHYFSLGSISLLAQLAGYQVIASKQLLTGYIPRLQILLRNHLPAVPVNISPVQSSATHAVMDNIKTSKQKRKQLADELLGITREGKPVGLWGVGADCYLLLRENPQLQALCRSGQCQLFDYQLAGKHYLGQQILSSAQIPEITYPVYLSPILAETRVKMHRVAQSWDKTVRDLFTTNTPLEYGYAPD